MEGASVSELYDLAVVGGGPAGTSAAITAAKPGWRVLLLEAGAFPRHKVCGEFVSGEAAEVLEGLLGRQHLIEFAPRISKTRIFSDDRMAELPVSPPALSISRLQLDQALWQRAIETGVCVRDRCTVSDVRRERDYFALTGNGTTFAARAVIDASGRWSRLRKRKPSSAKNWIGLKGHFHEDRNAESCDLYFFPGGYCGVQPLGDGRVNAAAMVRADVAHALHEVFALSQSLQQRTRKWRAASEPVSTAPLLFAPPRTVEHDMALVGDAAAFIDPFAGDGISIALHSGQMAAMALSKYLRDECSLTVALEHYDKQYRGLIHPALKNAARVRVLLKLPKIGRVAAMALLSFPILGHAAITSTRVRQSSNLAEIPPATARVASQ